MEGRLLLVDDDPGVLDLLNEYFAGQGYDVEVATSGEVALSAVRAKRPDLVILDIRMPGIDGVEVLRRLRRQDATLPVIMVTANEDVTLARETLNIGAFDYVAKPFVLAAARACFAGQGDAVRGALGELRLLLKPAVELGDLPAAGRDAVAAALERVGGGAPAA